MSSMYILTFHPNILLCKNKLYTINYLTKDPVRIYGSRTFDEEFK